MTEISFPFPSHYELEPIVESTGIESERVFSFSPGSRRTQTNGLRLRVVPHGHEAWIGHFAFGDAPGRSLTMVMSCPNPNELCVVSSGAGYIVRTDDPNSWRAIACTPVVKVKPLVVRGLLVFADFTKLAAFGQEGLKWESPRLSSDGIDITNTSDTRISVLGWSAAKQASYTSVIDVETGTIVSGSL